MHVKIIVIIPTYKMFSKEADDVVSIIDFVIFIIIWLNTIVTNNAIASLFPIFVFSICIPFLVVAICRIHTTTNIPTYYLQICRNYTLF